MQLLYQTHSPYARKVLVFAHETKLLPQLDVVHHETSPTRQNEMVYRYNPLGKVPVLICEDGLALFDSVVICDYLDSLHAGPKLIPAQGPERWETLRLQALAQGICDAGILLRWETERRPPALRYAALADGQAQKLAEAYAFVEQSIALEVSITVGHIALATALDWIVFRQLPGFERHSKLTAWYRDFIARPSMRATQYTGKTYD
ncbi:glutathione S-transferase (plasmid) [Phyllobacteriaceae bacterium JZ32]